MRCQELLPGHVGGMFHHEGLAAMVGHHLIERWKLASANALHPQKVFFDHGSLALWYDLDENPILLGIDVPDVGAIEHGRGAIGVVVQNAIGRCRRYPDRPDRLKWKLLVLSEILRGDLGRTDFDGAVVQSLEAQIIVVPQAAPRVGEADASIRLQCSSVVDHQLETAFANIFETLETGHVGIVCRHPPCPFVILGP